VNLVLNEHEARRHSVSHFEPTPRLVEVLDPALIGRPKPQRARGFRVEADILDIPAFLPPRSCA
jgi:hypothetical protein